MCTCQIISFQICSLCFSLLLTIEYYIYVFSRRYVGRNSQSTLSRKTFDNNFALYGLRWVYKNEDVMLVSKVYDIDIESTKNYHVVKPENLDIFDSDVCNFVCSDIYFPSGTPGKIEQGSTLILYCLLF